MYADEKALLARLELEKKIDVHALKLDQSSLRIYNRNPHLREIFISGGPKPLVQKSFKKENRLLNLQLMTSSYRTSKAVHDITTEYWGTRKLLLTDIEFLTNYARDQKYLVIYIGAAPGLHINFLSTLFPTLEFVLVDRKRIETKKTNNIYIRSGEFMDDIVKEYSKSRRDLLLICDVHSFGTQDDLDDNMLLDMNNQMKWHQSLKPIASLLTIHFPQRKNRIRFLKGDVIFEPWSSRHPNSCRLVALKGANDFEYDSRQLKSSMAYFQSELRTTYYEHDLEDSNDDGLDHCYDCRCEIFILSQYLEKIQDVKKPHLLSSVSTMSAKIAQNINDKSRSNIFPGVRSLTIIPKK